MTAQVEIRSGSVADLDALSAALGQRDYFTDHLARQHDGRGVLLISWLDGHPEVVGPLWPGIGTALIRAAEATARRFGHDRLLLGVGVDNPDARRLFHDHPPRPGGPGLSS
jgi:GNAT superfamily N-acetyltransferase